MSNSQIFTDGDSFSKAEPPRPKSVIYEPMSSKEEGYTYGLQKKGGKELFQSTIPRFKKIQVADDRNSQSGKWLTRSPAEIIPLQRMEVNKSGLKPNMELQIAGQSALRKHDGYVPRLSQSQNATKNRSQRDTKQQILNSTNLRLQTARRQEILLSHRRAKCDMTVVYLAVILLVLIAICLFESLHVK